MPRSPSAQPDRRRDLEVAPQDQPLGPPAVQGHLAGVQHHGLLEHLVPRRADQEAVARALVEREHLVVPRRLLPPLAQLGERPRGARPPGRSPGWDRPSTSKSSQRSSPNGVRTRWRGHGLPAASSVAAVALALHHHLARVARGAPASANVSSIDSPITGSAGPPFHSLGPLEARHLAQGRQQVGDVHVLRRAGPRLDARRRATRR